MPKQASITKDMVDRTAFALVREGGMDALTARGVAGRMGCSTQPIYKLYKNLDELKARVVEMVRGHAGRIIYGYRRTSVPFLNTGLGFIHFAQTEKVLFRVFNIENYLGDPVFGPLEDGYLFGLMEELLGDAPLDRAAREELFLNTMVYTNGLAHMAYAGQLGMSEKQVAERLTGVFFRFAGIEWKGDLGI